MSTIGNIARGIIAAVALSVLSLGSASAQTKLSAEAISTARQIIALKGADRMFNAVLPGMIEQTKSTFEMQNPMLGKDLREAAEQLKKDMANKNDDLINEVAKTYASKFTEQELKELLAFYQSPLGRKVVQQEPASLDESMKVAQTWSQNVSDEVFSRMRAEMKKRGHEF